MGISWQQIEEQTPTRTLEEARTLLEQADRNRRMIEAELADSNETLSDLTCQNQAITGAKLKCEQEMSSMSHDLDEMVAEAAISEEKAQRAMVDAARLADELRCEQDMAMGLERDKKLLECHVKELSYQQDEDRKNHERMQALIDQLQGKIRSY